MRDDLDRLDPPVAEDRDRRGEEAQPDRARLALRRACGELAEMLDVALHGRRRRLELGLARRVELEIGRIDDDVRAGELAELAHLGRRQRGLHGAAAAEHEDLLDARGDDRVDRSVGRVGRRQLLGREREHARDVERDVPVPDHDRPLVREVELEVLEVGVAVVPGDERGRGPRAGQVLARDPEPAVGLRAERVDDGVVEAEELVVRDVLPDLDVAEEPEPLRRARSSRTRARPP